MVKRKDIEDRRLTSWRPSPRRRGIYFFLIVMYWLTTVLLLELALILGMLEWWLWLILLVLVCFWFVTILLATVKDVAASRTPDAKIGSAPGYPVKKFVPRNLAHTLKYTDDEGVDHERNVVSEFLPTGAYQDFPGDDGHPSPLIVATAYDTREETTKLEKRTEVDMPIEVTTRSGILGWLKDKVVGGPIERGHIFAGHFQGEQYYIPCEPILVTVQDLPPDMRRFALGLGEPGTILEWTPVLWGPDRMEEPEKVPVSYESNLAWQYLDLNRQLEEEHVKNEMLRTELLTLYDLRGRWREPEEKLPPGVK